MQVVRHHGDVSQPVPIGGGNHEGRITDDGETAFINHGVTPVGDGDDKMQIAPVTAVPGGGRLGEVNGRLGGVELVEERLEARVGVVAFNGLAGEVSINDFPCVFPECAQGDITAETEAERGCVGCKCLGRAGGN